MSSLGFPLLPLMIHQFCLFGFCHCDLLLPEISVLLYISFFTKLKYCLYLYKAKPLWLCLFLLSLPRDFYFPCFPISIVPCIDLFWGESSCSLLLTLSRLDIDASCMWECLLNTWKLHSSLNVQNCRPECFLCRYFLKNTCLPYCWGDCCLQLIPMPNTLVCGDIHKYNVGAS